MKPSVGYMFRDYVYRAVLVCLMERGEASLRDIIDCLAGRFPGALRSPEALRRRLSVLEGLGIVERRVAIASARKDTWAVKKSVVRELQKALEGSSKN